MVEFFERGMPLKIKSRPKSFQKHFRNLCWGPCPSFSWNNSTFCWMFFSKSHAELWKQVQQQVWIPIFCLLMGMSAPTNLWSLRCVHVGRGKLTVSGWFRWLFQVDSVDMSRNHRKGRGARKIDGQRDGPMVTENKMLAIHFVAACVCVFWRGRSEETVLTNLEGNKGGEWWDILCDWCLWSLDWYTGTLLWVALFSCQVRVRSSSESRPPRRFVFKTLLRDGGI